MPANHQAGISERLGCADWAWKFREFRKQEANLTASAQDATRLARLRYNGGSTGYLEVLTNDTNYYTAQLNLAVAKENEALSIVQLYSALGGGWQ